MSLQPSSSTIQISIVRRINTFKIDLYELIEFSFSLSLFVLTFSKCYDDENGQSVECCVRIERSMCIVFLFHCRLDD